MNAIKPVAIVTGASTGIGKHISIKLSKNNYHVILISRNKQKLQLVEKYIKDIGNDCSIICADVGKKSSIEKISSILNIDKIDIIIHPQSIIHSMVEFNDGSIKAQLGVPDMKIPIQYALTYPDHLPAKWESLDLIKNSNISFEKPDLKKFPCIRLSYEALQEGGSFPIVLNIANDTAVASFLNKHIQFNDIPNLIEEALNKHDFIKEPNMESIIKLSQWTENYIHNKIAAIA